MNNVIVKNTKTIKVVSYVPTTTDIDILVTEGKFFLVTCKLEESVIWKKFGHHGYQKPVIVSIDEHPVKGDFVIDGGDGSIFQIQLNDPTKLSHYLKVLVHPEQFSNSQLESFAKDQIINNDIISVECERHINESASSDPDRRIIRTKITEFGNPILYKEKEKMILHKFVDTIK